jgi:hypothetical protein
VWEWESCAEQTQRLAGAGVCGLWAVGGRPVLFLGGKLRCLALACKTTAPSTNKSDAKAQVTIQKWRWGASHLGNSQRSQRLPVSGENHTLFAAQMGLIG